LKAFFGKVGAYLDKNEIRVILALTNCVEGNFDHAYDSFAGQVLKELSLPQETCFFKVNSVQMTSVQPRGLKELHDHIMGIMAQDPSLKNAFELIPLWKRIMGDKRPSGGHHCCKCGWILQQAGNCWHCCSCWRNLNLDEQTKNLIIVDS